MNEPQKPRESSYRSGDHESDTSTQTLADLAKDNLTTKIREPSEPENLLPKEVGHGSSLEVCLLCIDRSLTK